jgi:hypothetical protein
MSKLILSLGAIVALTAIFVIPSAYTPASTQVAKASSCSASTSHLSLTGSKSGSCSSSASGSQVHQGVSIRGGSESSCTSRSDAQRPGIGFSSSQGFSSNGAVSCSSNSP